MSQDLPRLSRIPPVVANKAETIAAEIVININNAEWEEYVIISDQKEKELNIIYPKPYTIAVAANNVRHREYYWQYLANYKGDVE